MAVRHSLTCVLAPAPPLRPVLSPVNVLTILSFAFVIYERRTRIVNLTEMK